MNPRLDGQPSRNPSGPYSQSASAYLHSGWWPIPVQGKNRPVAGATGKRGEVTQGRVKHWIRQLPTHNVGLRHEGTIAVDIDHHGDKTGAVTISRLEHAWGQLPPTWSSTSRGDGALSRQLFYRVPKDLRLRDLKDVEIIQHDYRYSIVWPSIHPETGETYFWFDPDGVRIDSPPAVGDLPELPERWLQGLIHGETLPGMSVPVRTPVSDVVMNPPATQRNNNLTRVAGKYARENASYDEYLRLCSEWNQRIESPLGHEEFLKTIQSIWKTDLYKAKSLAVEAAQSSPERELKLLDLTQTTVEATEWAWGGIIPLGVLTGVAGWAGIGKSTLISWLTAQWTTGELAGDLLGHPTCVLMVAGEDDISRQLVPRLSVAGADLSLVKVIQPTATSQTGDVYDTVMQLSQDLPDIRRMLVETKAKVLILDPILSFVEGNPNAQRDVRASLDPLAALARELNIAVVLVMHFKKGHGLASEKLSGSHVWRDTLRSLLVMAVDEETSLRVVSIDKSNYSDGRGDSYAFEVIGADVEGVDSLGVVRRQQVALAKFLGRSEKSVDDILQEEAMKRDGRRQVDNETAELIEWIKNQPIPMTWKQICTQAGLDSNGKSPDAKGQLTNLSKKLKRAVERGELSKTSKGTYGRSDGLTPLTEEF